MHNTYEVKFYGIHFCKIKPPPQKKGGGELSRESGSRSDIIQ